MNKFKLDDRVIVCREIYYCDNPLIGKKGRIIEVNPYETGSYTVEFDEFMREHKGKNQLGKSGHCKHVKPDEITLLVESSFEFNLEELV